MSDKAIVAVDVGMPGLPGNGITSSEKTTIQSDIATLQSNQGVLVKDEGSSLSTRALALNFVGAGVTATGSGTEKTITIPASVIPVQRGGVLQVNASAIDFASADFAVAVVGSVATISLFPEVPVTAYGIKSSSFSPVSTTLSDMHSINTPVLQSGQNYLIVAEVSLRAAPDAANDIIVYARIGSDPSVAGERHNVAGERQTLRASAHAFFTGAGAAVTVAVRAEMSAGSGTVTSAYIRVVAIPY